MKANLISIVAAVLLLFIGIFIWGYAGKSATTASVQGASRNGAASALTASETFYDFGTISMKKGNVTKEFTITNSSADDVLVPSLVTSCMCTTAYIVRADGSTAGPFGMPGHSGMVPPANELIKAGESRTIRIVYDPNAHGPAGVGQIDRFVTLTDAKGGTLEIEVKALVTP